MTNFAYRIVLDERKDKKRPMTFPEAEKFSLCQFSRSLLVSWKINYDKRLLTASKQESIIYLQPEIPVEFFNALVGQDFTVLVAPAGAFEIYE